MTRKVVTKSLNTVVHSDLSRTQSALLIARIKNELTLALSELSVQATKTRLYEEGVGVYTRYTAPYALIHTDVSGATSTLGVWDTACEAKAQMNEEIAYRIKEVL